MAALLQKCQTLAYEKIRVGLGIFLRLALAFFERPAIAKQAVMAALLSNFLRRAFSTGV